MTAPKQMQCPRCRGVQIVGASEPGPIKCRGCMAHVLRHEWHERVGRCLGKPSGGMGMDKGPRGPLEEILALLEGHEHSGDPCRDCRIMELAEAMRRGAG